MSPPVAPPGGSAEIFSRRVRYLGGLWVVGTVPFVTAVAVRYVHTTGSYVFVLIFFSCGAFTAPGLVTTWHAAGHTGARDRPGGILAFAGLATAFSIGVAVLIGLATGWRWANPAGVPAVALAGLFHVAGLITWTRLRSGGRALSVDVIESVTAVLAVTAPLVVLWGPAVADAEAPWFAVPTAAATVCAIAATYWTVVLFVRMGPSRGPFEAGAVALSGLGAVNAALQTAQGVSGFDLPAPPLVALNAVCFSMYLLVPLNAPTLMGSGLELLPPQSQVRGARLATVVTLAGLAALWAATLAVAGERAWAVPFSFVVVSLLLVLAGVRQMAAAQETRRLYRQVEEAADERQRLLTQLLERTVDDRRRFASQLYAQAAAAYASFSMMAASDLAPAASPSAVAKVSARVGGDLARQAKSVHELTLAIRPLEGERDQSERLGIPLRAYLATLYGDRTPPRLTVEVRDAPDLALDWVTETVLLQIAQEALHNVRRHSLATTVEVTIQAAGDRVVLRVADTGVGFDPAAVPEGPGIAIMRAAAAVSEGTLLIESAPARGTTVVGHLGPDRHADRRPPARPAAPVLRLVHDGEAGRGGTVPP